MDASSTALSREQPYATKSAVLQTFQQYGKAYSFWGIAESHLIPPPSPHGREGSSFPGLVLPNDTVNCESMVAMKPSDSGVVVGYQVGEFTHTWMAEHFIAHSHIYP